MNDRFKFRAFHKTRKKMLEVLAIDFNYKFAECHEPAAEGYGGWLTNEVNFEELHIMQCTGLKDKDGNLIYEGDTLKEANYPCCVAAVEFDNGRYRWDFGGEWGEIVSECVEIIGNIYENPELIKIPDR